jgi:hypothetical protein
MNLKSTFIIDDLEKSRHSGAGRLVVDDGPPMDMPIFCCHLLPPNDEDFSLPGSSIAQIRTAGKTG